MLSPDPTVRGQDAAEGNRSTCLKIIVTEIHPLWGLLPSSCRLLDSSCSPSGGRVAVEISVRRALSLGTAFSGYNWRASWVSWITITICGTARSISQRPEPGRLR